MGRLPKSRQAFSDNDVPHEIIPEIPMRLVGQLHVRQNGKLLDTVGAELTPAGLREFIEVKHGPGRYQISATTIAGTQLEGYAVIEVADDARSLGGNFSQLVPPQVPVISDAGVHAGKELLMDQSRNMQREKSEIMALRAAGEKAQSDHIVQTINLMRSQMDQQSQMFREMMASSRQGDQSLDAIRRNLMASTTEAEKERYESSLDELKAQQALRDQLWQQQVAMERERADIRLQMQQEKTKMDMELFEQRFKNQLELMQARQELEMKRLEDQSTKNSDLLLYDGAKARSSCESWTRNIRCRPGSMGSSAWSSRSSRSRRNIYRWSCRC
jgi:hypothetical protein